MMLFCRWKAKFSKVLFSVFVNKAIKLPGICVFLLNLCKYEFVEICVVLLK